MKEDKVLSSVQFDELIALAKVLPAGAVKERLVCIVQWKSADVHAKFRSAVNALFRGRRQGHRGVSQECSDDEEETKAASRCQSKEKGEG